MKTVFCLCFLFEEFGLVLPCWAVNDVTEHSVFSLIRWNRHLWVILYLSDVAFKIICEIVNNHDIVSPALPQPPFHNNTSLLLKYFVYWWMWQNIYWTSLLNSLSEAELELSISLGKVYTMSFLTPPLHYPLAHFCLLRPFWCSKK